MVATDTAWKARAKKGAKEVLYHAGMLKPAQKVYFNLRTFSPEVLSKERVYRKEGAPDGYACPPGHLIYDIIACHWASVYYESGQILAGQIKECLHKNNLALAYFESILDFGCGCGRILRHIASETDAVLYGSDINERLIHWCDANLPFAAFSTNPLAPPLELPAGVIEFAYARSVFTHLPEALQLAWIKELHRVISPGGYLYLTTHGRAMMAGLNEDERGVALSGRLITHYEGVAGDNLCSTFATRTFMEWLTKDYFELVDHIPGKEERHRRQDVYLFRKVMVRHPDRNSSRCEM